MGSLDKTYDKYINLQLRWPTPSLFPSKLLTEAAQGTLLNPKVTAQTLVYGPDPGHELVRTGTAEWLSRFYNPEAGDVQPDRLFMTPGASGALSMLLTRFTDPNFTQYIWMIEPTYFLACPNFQEARFQGRLRGVPEDAEGLDIEFLRSGLIEAQAKLCQKKSTTDGAVFARSSKLYRHIIYMVPTFSNPSAKVISLRRRREVVQLAREFNALIISDDVYDWLRWPHPNSTVGAELPKPPPRLLDVDRAMPGGSTWGNAVSNGSFSKVVAPGMRVGWVEGSPLIAKDLCKIGPVHSGGCQSQLLSTFIGRMLVSGKLEEHIQSTLIPVYQRRHRAMLKSIETNLLPLGFKTSSIKTFDSESDEEAALAGGFFLYLDFPTGSPPADTVAKVALEEFNLRIAHGEMMCVAGDAGSAQKSKKGFGQGARLCWAWHEEADIEEGIQRLALAFQSAQARSISL